MTRDMDLVAPLAGSSLCRDLFVSTKIAHAGVVGSGCDEGRMHLPVTVMSSCPMADISVTSRGCCPWREPHVAADLLGRGIVVSLDGCVQIRLIWRLFGRRTRPHMPMSGPTHRLAVAPLADQ